MSPEERRRKIRQKINMKEHLNELTVLMGRPVHADDLESLEKTDAICEVWDKHIGELERKVEEYEIPFSDRLLQRFKIFVKNLFDANPSPVYAWVERSNVCGTLLIPSVLSIRFDFEFTLERNAVISFLTSDFKDRLLLDFFLSEEGEQRLEVKTEGRNWGVVKY